MKLIIEIPIDLLERTKSGDYDFGDDLARNEVIVNGTPYNPSGDAISREALKKDIEENSIVLQGVQAIEVACAKVLIDSAQAVPQVTVFTETADENAVADLKARQKNE